MDGVSQYSEKSPNPLLKPMVLFTYSTEHLEKKDKVSFFYALNGRNKKKGVIDQYQLLHLGVSVILVPKQFRIAFIEFLKKWHVKFEAKEMLVE